MAKQKINWITTDMPGILFEDNEVGRPYLKEPFSEGWKSIYELPMRGSFTRL